MSNFIKIKNKINKFNKNLLLMVIKVYLLDGLYYPHNLKKNVNHQIYYYQKM